MNNERLQAALNYIGDDLIAEAADYRPKPSIRSKRKLVIKYAACAAAVLAGVIGLKLWSDIKFGEGATLEKQLSANDAISAIISALSPKSSEDSSPGIRFSPVYEKGSPTLEEWRGYENVIWNNDRKPDSSGLKSNEFGDSARDYDARPGMAIIPNKLLEIAAMEPYSAYAVRVDFEPCRNEKEMGAWKYKGMTIEQIKNKLILLELDFSKQQIADISDREASDRAYEEQVTRFAELLDDACYDYYLVKMQEFYDTFRSQNLEIYPVEQGSVDDYSWFYCFFYREQLLEFTCKPDEAFYFEPADR